jgi:hypothetical protein
MVMRTTPSERCVSGLTPGNYTVNETTQPDGYGDAGQTNQSVEAVDGTNCGYERDDQYS